MQRRKDLLRLWVDSLLNSLPRFASYKAAALLTTWPCSFAVQRSKQLAYSRLGLATLCSWGRSQHLDKLFPARSNVAQSCCVTNPYTYPDLAMTTNVAATAEVPGTHLSLRIWVYDRPRNRSVDPNDLLLRFHFTHEFHLVFASHLQRLTQIVQFLAYILD